MKVYESIRLVAAAMSQSGISKGRKNAQQGYNFRGIDDVLNTLSAALVDANLVIMPRVLDRTQTERATAKGGALFYVTATVEFKFINSEDFSHDAVVIVGEAMDSADKATNKAISAAYKYMALTTFCIPVQGTPDADEVTHEVAGVPMKEERRSIKFSEPEPTPAPLVDDGVLSAMLEAIDGAATMRDLRDHFNAAFRQCEGDDKAIARLTNAKDKRKLSIEAHANNPKARVAA